MQIWNESILCLVFLSEMQLAAKFQHDGRFVETGGGKTFVKCQSDEVKTQGLGVFHNCPMDGCNNSYQNSIQTSCKSSTCFNVRSEYRFGCDLHQYAHSFLLDDIFQLGDPSVWIQTDIHNH
jgi:hypothetical protein